MRRSVALGTLALACFGALACASEPKSPNQPGPCTADLDCDVGQSCVDGECASSVPIGTGEGEGAASGEGEGASSGEGEGASSGEGEGASSGEGEGVAFTGEGEGAAGGEGEGEGEGATSGALFVRAGPDLVNALPGCQCDVQNVPASNVNLALVSASGAVCHDPTDPSCGIDGGKCSCGIANASWFAARQEEPRGTNDVWIVDEGITQPSGRDDTLTVKASLADDCLLSPASTTASTNEACFQLDCDGDFGAPACFDYTQLGATCGTAASNAATVATSADCMARGPVPVRVHVEATGAFAREFCTTMNDGNSVDAVVLRRSGGALSVASVSPSMTEVAVGAPCP
jgi:hypothetical protein